jgi:hypothetical protein
MVSQRFNLIEQLKIFERQKPSKELFKKSPFHPIDVPDVFRRMYEVANSLASKEGLIWIQVKYRQDVIDKLHKQESTNAGNVGDEPAPPLLEAQLLDFVNSRREEYMQRMTQLLDLYAKSGWSHKEEHQDK